MVAAVNSRGAMLSAVLAAPLELKHDKDVEVYTEQDLTTVRYSGDGRRVATAADKKLAFGRRRDVQIEIECLFHHVEVSPRFAPLL